MVQKQMLTAKYLSTLILVSLAGTSLIAAPMRLQNETTEAWRAYVRTVSKRAEVGTLAPGPSTAEPAVGDGTVAVPGGLIHHWRGNIFIPGANAVGVREVLSDFDHYKEFYAPTVVDSHGSEQRLKTRWVTKVAGITSAAEAEYECVSVVRPGGGYMETVSTRLQEIRNFGESDEYLLPPGVGSGFVWSLASILNYREADGGTYLDLDAMELSRNIPECFRWVVKPIVNRLSKYYVETTLQQTRAAVLARQRLPVVAERR
jgi:hypothetical protein